MLAARHLCGLIPTHWMRLFQHLWHTEQAVDSSYSNTWVHPDITALFFTYCACIKQSLLLNRNSYMPRSYRERPERTLMLNFYWMFLQDYKTGKATNQLCPNFVGLDHLYINSHTCVVHLNLTFLSVPFVLPVQNAAHWFACISAGNMSWSHGQVGEVSRPAGLLHVKQSGCVSLFVPHK